MNREPHVPTSEVLVELLRGTSSDHVTLAWLLGSLRERSFGIFLFLIALVGLLPGVSFVAGLLLTIPAVQMILARPFPVLPDAIASRRLPIERVARLVARILPPLRWLERFVYPRWSTPFETTKRVIGVVVLLLAPTLLSPLPFSHIIPILVIMLIAFAFLEQDGVLLSIALLFAAISIAVTAGTVWATIVTARLL